MHCPIPALLMLGHWDLRSAAKICGPICNALTGIYPYLAINLYSHWPDSLARQGGRRAWRAYLPGFWRWLQIVVALKPVHVALTLGLSLVSRSFRGVGPGFLVQLGCFCWPCLFWWFHSFFVLSFWNKCDALRPIEWQKARIHARPAS